MNLGRLERVRLREIWKHEASDFTTWLALEENIELLSDELGLNISVIEMEHKVGSFNVDLLCEEEETGKKIIIENQLEKTNHDHLGKIITYASGVEASYVIWIASEIREEHQSAIEWLNRNTNENLKFFLIRIEAWKIGESAVAPKFNVIEEPNTWSKTIKAAGKEDVLTDAKMNRIEFWTALSEAIEKSSVQFNARKPSTDHWYNIAIGNKDAYIAIDLLQKLKSIRINLYIPNNKVLFEYLYNQKDAIEDYYGDKFTWDSGEGKKKSNFYLSIEDFDVTQKDNWNTIIGTILEKADRLKNTFHKFYSNDRGGV